MTPLLLIPFGLISFLTGAALGVDRRGLSMLPASPIRGVPMASWRRYVTVMVVARPNTKTPRGRMGAWGLDARHLADAHMVTGAHKATVCGVDGVWVGQWTPPLSEAQFLASPRLQYLAFARAARRAAPEAAKLAGKEVMVEGESRKCSLSGLLGVCHVAGVAGMKSWVDDARVRDKFGNTTKVFQKTNGIF